MYEFTIQKKELHLFDTYSLLNVEGAFSQIQHIAFNETKRLKIKDTELIVSAVPSGNSIGGTAWKIEFQKQTILYGLELKDKQSQITPPLQPDHFKNVNIFITNAFPSPLSQLDLSNLGYQPSLASSTGKYHQFVSIERLKAKVEQAILETQTQILIPCTSKNKILSLLLIFEQMFQTNQKLAQAATRQKQLDED